MDFYVEPCTVKLNSVESAADCGTRMVPETRANPNRRLILLPLTRIRATGGHPVEPIFHLGGGPGASNLQAKPLESLLANHDFVLVGYRGVDGSVKLDCPEVSQAIKGDGVDVVTQQLIQKNQTLSTKENVIMKAFINRNQISIFFIATLLIGWLPWYTGQGSIIFAAPSLAAFIVAFLANGREGVIDILRRLGRWRANWRWYVFVLFSPAVLYFFAVGVHVVLGGTTPLFPLLRENQLMILMVFIAFLLPWQSSAFLEEIGFRGYALGQLQDKFGPLVGTLILGIFFGAWLLPEFFQTDSLQYAMGGLRFFP
jgi:membrane protease YdiL (CAAX protease family)